MKDVIIIGGGLAGLINGILLHRSGLKVRLYEEKQYPFHRVCGEYISNEVVPFLTKHELFPTALSPASISQFQLSSVSGKTLEMPLDLGGFGVSRYGYDYWLAQKAVNEGLEIIHERITAVAFAEDHFLLEGKSGTTDRSKLIIGAFGKRSILDKKLDRSFMAKRHPYVGIKYHLKTDAMAHDKIALHNFPGGYCGMSSVGEDTFNLCYLVHRSELKKHGGVQELEHHALKQNPYLNAVFSDAQFLFEKPEVINEISFEQKEPVFNHIFMSGDAGGMIAPLCGNGMAMAIHSAKILSELIIQALRQGIDRDQLEKEYAKCWNALFARRLWAGRNIQKLFGSPLASEIAVASGKMLSPLAKYLMKQTHGKPFS